MLFELSLFNSLGWIIVLLAAVVLLVVISILKNRTFVRKRAIQKDKDFSFGHLVNQIINRYPDGVYGWNYVSRREMYNAELAKILGFPADTQLHYHNLKEKFYGDTLQSLEEAISSLKADGSSFSIRLESFDFIYNINGFRLNTSDQKPLADLVLLRKDENNIKTSLHENRSEVNDQHLVTLLNALPIPLWIRDNAESIVFKNEKAEKILLSGGESIPDHANKTGSVKIGRKMTEADLRVTEVPFAHSKFKGSLAIGIPLPEVTNSEAEYSLNLKEVLKGIKLAVCIFGSNGNISVFNDSFLELWGLESEWLNTQPSMRNFLERLRDLRHLPEVPDFSLFRDAEIKRLSEGVSGNDMLHLPDGRTISRCWHPDLQGGVIFSFEDVSGKLSLERSIKSLDAVQRTTIDNLPEGIAAFGQDGRLTIFNPEFCRLWNVSAENLSIGLSVNELVQIMQPLLPEEGIWAESAEAIAANLLVREFRSGRIDLVNGSTLQYSHIPLPNGAKLISYLDITDSTRVEDALRDRARALAEADRLKSEFIANVSFEIRTPLNTIVGFSEMLKQEYFGELNHRQKEYAEGIIETSRGLTKIVSDIMELTSIEAGLEELDVGSIDLHALLAESLSRLKERIQQNSLKLEFDCSPNIGRIVGDEKRLLQVVYNLLSNAINFSPRYGVICLKGERLKDTVVISVSDNGIGIQKVDRERVLQPFQVGSEPRTGVGLGLTLVRNFLNLHNGSLEITSASPRGTVVRCTLPIDPTVIHDEGQVMSRVDNKR